MADKSLLSLKGEVSWVAGGYDNVINSTKRMMRDMNTATTSEIRAGQRAREGAVQASIKKIEDQEKAASDRLVKSKQQVASRLASVRAESRAPPKRRTDESNREFNARKRNIENLVKAGEDAHKRLQSLQARTGRSGSDIALGDYGSFATQGAGKREAELQDLKEIQGEIAAEREEKEKLYKAELDAKRGSKKVAVDLRKEIERLKIAEEDLGTTISDGNKIHRRSIGYEKEEREELKKLSEAKRKLYKLDKEIYHKTVQMERDMIDLNREMAEEIGRVRQEAGEGLRDAFTYATVAIMAFWYKLTPVVETFKEFEAELVNAQSIWQNSQEELNELSDQVVQFGQNFGIEMGKATEGLYQYASAGVEAAEAMQMLNHTLTLSMAVQGDHNTLAKLTTQTIMGFGMEFSDAAEVTDKFAHAINMSLIEWDDLASSIKFALPFFTSTGQSLDQLLGALSVLTNRALEAGIAGRGLRQALAEFAQHADDNSAAFAKMGVQILDNEGNMKQLTEIAAQFQEVMGEGVNDMDVMMALMDDLNIRGATAFVHLVQNAEEFQEQVDDLQNSAGSAAKMAEIQQKSLANQIQLVKNAMQAPFLMSDEIGEAAGYTNEFGLALHTMVKEFEALIVVNQNGTKELTEFGQFIKDFVIYAMQELVVLFKNVIELLKKFGSEGDAARRFLHMFTIPLNLLLKILTKLGPTFLSTLILYKTMNKILPTNIINTWNMIAAKKAELVATKASMLAQLQATQFMDEHTAHQIVAEAGFENVTKAMWTQIAAQAALKIGMFAIVYAVQRLSKNSLGYSAILGGIIGLLTSFVILANMAAVAGGSLLDPSTYATLGTRAIAGTITAGIATGAAIGMITQQTMKDIPSATGDNEHLADVEYAMGGRVLPMRQYASGGRALGGADNRHFPIMVEGGETIIPKTRNMLNGGASGVTINISGDVYDGDNFAKKVGQALPNALRNVNDIGGM